MRKENTLVGGFTSINHGKIVNCHSSIDISTNIVVSGFCAKNKGEIHSSIYSGRIKRPKDASAGLCKIQTGILKDSLWIKPHKNTKESKFVDLDLSISKKDLDSNNIPEIMKNWDITSTWCLEDGEISLIKGFNDTSTTNIIEISTREDLLKFAEDVNNGLVKEGLVYKLVNDIDLKGKEWTPIGIDHNYPFVSCFDGNNFEIRNFKIKSNKFSNAGFFGCIEEIGVVKNLTVDCVITGKGSVSGGICGLNKGRISNCIVKTVTSASRYTGGFVGQNEGTVINCSVFGRIKPIMFPLCWIGIPAIILPTILLIALFIIGGNGEDFTPIVLDPNTTIITEDEVKEPENISEVNNSFIMNKDVVLYQKVGKVGLKCPNWSDKGFVATYIITSEELAKHDINQGPIELHKTGLISPGYKIENINFSKLPSLSKGNYEVLVLLEFYDLKTYEKYPVDTNVCVNFKIK